MRCTWDAEKDEASQRAHGLSFGTAVLVFDDPLAATRDDPYPYEDRWRTMGIVGGVVVMVIHTGPLADSDIGDGVVRIISARKATRREREAYEGGEY